MCTEPVVKVLHQVARTCREAMYMPVETLEQGSLVAELSELAYDSTSQHWTQEATQEALQAHHARGTSMMWG